MNQSTGSSLQQLGLQLPMTFFSESGFSGDETVLSGVANQLLVVEGIDIVSQVGALGSEFAAGLASTGADFFFHANSSDLIEYDNWRGRIVIDEGDGLNLVDRGGTFDVYVWGYITAAPLEV